MEFDQARQVVLIVARFDNITVDDRTIVMNSMDTRTDAGFIPGYYSFSIIRESDSPARPDETIRMYVVSKKTADTWEMNLCIRREPMWPTILTCPKQSVVPIKHR
jgi:hypothetical protein